MWQVLWVSNVDTGAWADREGPDETSLTTRLVEAQGGSIASHEFHMLKS